MMKVDIWTDIVCPFCYIGNTQFKKALESFDHKDQVEVVHHSYQLLPDAPKKPTGRKGYEDLAKIKGGTVSEMLEGYSQVARAGKNEGLDMKMLETTLTSTFDGHQLIHFASKHGKQEEAVFAMFESYFTDTSDVADREVLKSVAKKIGLDEKAFEKSLETNEFANDVKADIRNAASIGVQGVPFFMIDNTFGVSGARGINGFVAILDKAWKEIHPPHMLDANNAVNVCTDKSCA